MTASPVRAHSPATVTPGGVALPVVGVGGSGVGGILVFVFGSVFFSQPFFSLYPLGLTAQQQQPQQPQPLPVDDDGDRALNALAELAN